MDLTGKAALITGGGVGTGRAIALDLAASGCDVAVNYSKSKTECDLTATDIESHGVRSLSIGADVRDDAAVRAMVERVVAGFGRLDIVVNNAGVTSFIDHADLEGVGEEDWERILSTNLKGAFYVARAAAPALKASGAGAIINVSSIAGVYHVGSSIPYCASKAALNSLTVTLARALAPEIRVNAVAPGFIDSGWWSEHPGYEAIKQLSAALAPLQAVCQPRDVSRAVLGLLGADMVTGQVLVVDGGMGISGGLPSRR
jgi:3-oxoacyl-[acyl-carrier protein] reductase